MLTDCKTATLVLTLANFKYQRVQLQITHHSLNFSLMKSVSFIPFHNLICERVGNKQYLVR